MTDEHGNWQEMRLEIGRAQDSLCSKPRSMTMNLKVIGNNLFVFRHFKTLNFQSSRNKCSFCLYFAKIFYCHSALVHEENIHGSAFT